MNADDQRESALFLTKITVLCRKDMPTIRPHRQRHQFSRYGVRVYIYVMAAGSSQGRSTTYRAGDDGALKLAEESANPERRGQPMREVGTMLRPCSVRLSETPQILVVHTIESSHSRGMAWWAQKLISLPVAFISSTHRTSPRLPSPSPLTPVDH